MQNTDIPAYLQARAGKGPDISVLTAGIGGGRGPHISIKSNRFSFVDSDGTGKFPTDTNGNALFDQKLAAPYIDVIVIDAAAAVFKAYYDKKWVEGDSAPPDCWSNDGQYPDASIFEPVSDMCHGCPKNAFGSALAQDGSQGGGKACADRKRLAVISLYDPKGPIYEFSVSPSNLKAWAAYAIEVAGRGIPGGVTSIVTRMTIDTNRNGGILFAPMVNPQTGAGYLFIPENWFAYLDSARESIECKRAIGADRPAMIALNAPAAQPALAGPAPQQQQQQPVLEAPAAPQPAARRTRRSKEQIDAEAAALREAQQGVAAVQQQPVQQAPQPAADPFGQAQPQPQQQPPALTADPFAVAGGAPAAAAVADPFALPASLDRRPQAATQFGVATGVQPTDPFLDAMLDKALA